MAIDYEAMHIYLQLATDVYRGWYMPVITAKEIIAAIRSAQERCVGQYGYVPLLGVALNDEAMDDVLSDDSLTWLTQFPERGHPKLLGIDLVHRKDQVSRLIVFMR